MREKVIVLFRACMPLMISVIDCPMNTAPTTCPKKVMGTATATRLPLMTSSEESPSSASCVSPRSALSAVVVRLSEEGASVFRSSSVPMCVAT